MVRGAVLLGDAESGDGVFEGVASAAVSGGIDASVIGERGCGGAVFFDESEGGCQDVVTGDGTVGGAGQQEP